MVLPHDPRGSITGEVGCRRCGGCQAWVVLNHKNHGRSKRYIGEVETSGRMDIYDIEEVDSNKEADSGDIRGRSFETSSKKVVEDGRFGFKGLIWSKRERLESLQLFACELEAGMRMM